MAIVQLKQSQGRTYKDSAMQFHGSLKRLWFYNIFLMSKVVFFHHPWNKSVIKCVVPVFSVWWSFWLKNISDTKFVMSSKLIIRYSWVTNKKRCKPLNFLTIFKWPDFPSLRESTLILLKAIVCSYMASRVHQLCSDP